MPDDPSETYSKGNQINGIAGFLVSNADLSVIQNCRQLYIQFRLVAQMVKNLPAMQKTWVQSLGWEDPPEEGMATHSSIPAWSISKDRGA